MCSAVSVRLSDEMRLSLRFWKVVNVCDVGYRLNATTRTKLSRITKYGVVEGEAKTAFIFTTCSSSHHVVRIDGKLSSSG